MRPFIVMILACIVQGIRASYKSAISQNNGLKRTPPMSMHERFRKMCNSFETNRNNRQYAVAWIGDEDYSPPQRFSFEDKEIKKGNGDKYYVAALPEADEQPAGAASQQPSGAASQQPSGAASQQPSGAASQQPSGAASASGQNSDAKPHSERIMFKYIDEQVKRYQEKNAGKKPDVYLYTKDSPCCYNPNKKDFDDEDCATGCSRRIADWSSEQGIKLTVAWDYKYRLSEKAQLFSINNILKSEKAYINWDIENGKIRHFCPKPDQPNKVESLWFQKGMFDCLVNRESAAAALCSNDENLLKKDMAKFVNRMIWECGTAKDAQSDTSSASDANCWKVKSKRYATFDDKTYRICLADVLRVKRPNYQMGPPLDPENPNVYNMALKKDLNERAERFCFTP
eukprot:Seg4405.3 transcript_id=Seg4405.3/GoldUCD/mRNA.D3Y31 product="TM2 domain-containing protein" protein_id=Seg4405.3/GoldUCD/D3Y31